MIFTQLEMSEESNVDFIQDIGARSLRSCCDRAYRDGRIECRVGRKAVEEVTPGVAVILGLEATVLDANAFHNGAIDGNGAPVRILTDRAR